MSDPRITSGELLFPALYPRDRVDSLRVSLGVDAFGWQYNQRGDKRKGQLVDVEHLRYYDDGDLPSFDWVVHSWDCAVEERDESSHVVGQVWGVVYHDPLSHYYLLDLERDHAGLAKNVGMIRSLLRRSPGANEILIERKANGAPIIQLIENEFPGVVSISPSGSKAARLVAIKPEIDAGCVFLPRGAEWVDAFVAEVRDFRGKGDASDQVDAMTQAISHLRERRSKRMYWSR